MESPNAETAEIAKPCAERECEVCSKNPAKYCCPKCGTRSCSLPCVKLHKDEIDCDGIRERIAYVPLTGFDELNLLSDYRFLEESARCIDNAMRYPLKRPRHSLALSRKIPFWQYRLVIECRKRGTCLMIFPETFRRRKINTTYFNGRTKEMFWCIEWIFAQAGVKHTSEKVSENITLGEALQSYMSPDSCDPDVKQCLCFYQSAGFGGVIPLMKVERIRCKGSKYVELDFSETIRANLVGKTIIEFPTIHLVLQHHKLCYEMLETATEKPITRELEEGELETTDQESDENTPEDVIYRQPTQQLFGPLSYQIDSNALSESSE